MALSCNRAFRFLRSIFVPTATILGFSCLLLFFFILYQPTDGPGDQLRLGWQSWDYISSSSDAAYIGAGSANAEEEQITSPGQEDTSVPEGTDWWNVTQPEGQTVDSASLPLDIWNPLLPHDTGCEYIFYLAFQVDGGVARVCQTDNSALFISANLLRVHDCVYQSTVPQSSCAARLAMFILVNRI